MKKLRLFKSIFKTKKGGYSRFLHGGDEKTFFLLGSRSWREMASGVNQAGKSATRSLGRKRTSPVWKYFTDRVTENNEKFVSCNVISGAGTPCGIWKDKTDHNPTNMETHVFRYHSGDGSGAAEELTKIRDEVEKKKGKAVNESLKQADIRQSFVRQSYDPKTLTIA